MPSPTEIERAAKRRVEILRKIVESVNGRGYPPTVSELAEATGVTKRQIRTDLDALVAAGAIERDPGVTRGLRVVEAASR